MNTIKATLIKWFGPLYYVRLTLVLLTIISATLDILNTGTFNWQVEGATVLPIIIAWFFTKSEDQMVAIFGANWKMRFFGLGQAIYGAFLNVIITVGKFNWPMFLSQVALLFHTWLGKGKDTHTLADGQQIVMPPDASTHEEVIVQSPTLGDPALAKNTATFPAP